MLAPGQRFITDAQVTGTRALGEQAQVIEQNVFVAHRIGRRIAADQHQIGAQLLHQIEFAFGTVDIALQTITAAAFEIAERLEQGDGDAQVGTHLPDVAWAAVVIQQVVFENLDAVKAGCGDGFELFGQSTAQGYGSN